MEREAPGSYLSIRGSIHPHLAVPGDQSAGRAPRADAGRGLRAGAWWPGPSRHPGRALAGGGAGGLTQNSGGGVTRPQRAARLHDVNPQGCALLCRLPRVTGVTAAGGAVGGLAPPCHVNERRHSRPMASGGSELIASGRGYKRARGLRGAGAAAS